MPTGLAEHLQSSNMNFYQDEDTLYIIGGYAFSPTANDHITFSNMATIIVSSTIQAIINGTNFAPFCKQITDPIFAVTGGQLGKIDNIFHLVGGQRFDGRYNPMGNPTYTQTYTNQIRKFTIDNSGTQLSYSSYATLTDPVHLRRRDYNLLAQIFPDGSHGYTISSGVFQLNADLPFLYPIDITSSGYVPVTSFNQYLSNYHSAKAALYDSTANAMHMLFFGGISQYYYQAGSLTKDDDVPFVKTISLVSRDAGGVLKEYRLPAEMPGLKGSSAEFIPNYDIEHYKNDIIKMNSFNSDTMLIGHILGGISSNSINPFSTNQTNTTSASNTLYAVKLVKGGGAGIEYVNVPQRFDCTVFPNPAFSKVALRVTKTGFTNAVYYISSADGELIKHGMFTAPQLRNDEYELDLNGITSQTLFITVVFDDIFYVHKKLVKH
jgi:hypothetical protein